MSSSGNPPTPPQPPRSSATGPRREIPEAVHDLVVASAGWGEACEIELGAGLDRCSTLRIGGPADALVRVHDERTLSQLLAFCSSRDLPLMMVGQGANLLFPDDGVRGVVCRLMGSFKKWEIEAPEVRAGAGAVLAQIARACAREGLVGLEALAGFPATVGGAVTMNAGCYGTEISELLKEVRVLDRTGQARIVPASCLEANYRSTRFQTSGEIVVGASFLLRHGDAAEALARLEELNRRRWQSLPSGQPNAGSTFRNPPGAFAGRLLEDVGVKGLTIGGASLSAKHANVVVNEGGASADDVLMLMIEARERVRDRFGVSLRPEFVMIGDLAERWRAHFGEGEGEGEDERPAQAATETC